MTETLEPVASEVDQRQLAEQLLPQAKTQGVELVGPIGLLKQPTKTILETALEAEMTEDLGYDKHDPTRRTGGNSRNGTRSKTVLTEIGPVPIEVREIPTTRSIPRSSGSVAWVAVALTCFGLAAGMMNAAMNIAAERRTQPRPGDHADFSRRLQF